MKFKKEVKIAVIVTLIILLFFWGHNFLKGKNLFSAFNYYYASFERIDELQVSNSVTINGFPVGVVSAIRFENEKLDRLLVEIGIKKIYKIPDNSIAMITSDLLGSKSITLLLGNSETILVNGGNLRDSIAPDLITTITEKLLPIVDNADKIFVSFDSLLQSLNHTFDDNMQKNIQNLVANLDQMVVSERRKIAVMLSNFEIMSGNLQKSSDDISNLISNLSSFSETLSESDVKSTMDKANSSLTQLNNLLTGINEGQGTIGKFAKDDLLYLHLQRSAEDLDKLLIDLRENPGRYVNFSLFGGRKTKQD